MKDVIKAPRVSLFIPIRAESKPHSCVLILNAKLMVNLINDGNRWCSVKIIRQQTISPMSASSRNLFQDWSISSGPHAAPRWRYTLMAATALQFKLQMKDQRGKCEFLTVLTSLPFAHPTAPQTRKW